MGLFHPKASKTPVAAQLIGGRNKESLLQDAGLAALGDYLAGEVGAVAGAVLAPGVDYATFQVTFADGHQETREVKADGKDFERYWNLPDCPADEQAFDALPMDDIDRDDGPWMLADDEGATAPQPGAPPAQPHIPVSTATQLNAFAKGEAPMATISAGTYEFGVDLPQGKFNLHLAGGDGWIDLTNTRAEAHEAVAAGEEYSSEDIWHPANAKDTIFMGTTQSNQCQDYRNLDSARFGGMSIVGSLVVEITRSQPIEV